MALQHMFRNAELITLICRLDYSENYSYSPQLETALTPMVQIIKTTACSSLIHSDFDNFDNCMVIGSVHTAHLIMLQEVDQVDEEAVELDIPTIERTKQRS